MNASLAAGDEGYRPVFRRNAAMNGPNHRLRAAAWPAVFVAALGLAACGPPPPPEMPPMQIEVFEARSADIDLTLDMVGQTLGSVDIPIRARVDGVLEEIHFLQGREVRKDQLLYVIDPRPFEARVVEAQSVLAEAETGLAKASSDLDRIRPLAEINAVSQQDLDAAVAQYEAAQASVEAGKARVEQAEIELGYTRITSPVDGLIGITEAKVGEYVGRSPNPVVLNVVSRTDPIRVRFSINEREYLEFARRFAETMRNIDDDNPQGRGLKLILSDRTIHDQPGQIVNFDAAIDPTTGTLTLEADFANPGRVILPGQFARVRGVIETRRGAIAVPQRAVIETQGLFQLAVVGDDDVVELRRVEMGPRTPDGWIVESGLAAGERIALEGLQRLRTGTRVEPKPQDIAGAG
ncbi:MAG: efflux RND transporter periplasmic adaptor subunit [Pseudomonadota bacterium]